MEQPFFALSPAEQERLHILIEECGELIQAATKALRHGWDSTHPDGGPTNRESFHRECADVMAATRMMWVSGDINWQQLCDYQAIKYTKLPQYLHHNPHITEKSLKDGRF
jgi:hypothetical protein